LPEEAGKTDEAGFAYAHTAVSAADIPQSIQRYEYSNNAGLRFPVIEAYPAKKRRKKQVYHA